MATAVQAIRPRAKLVTRERILAGIFLLASLLILFVFARGIEPGQETKFILNPGRATVAIKLPPWVLPTQTTLYLLAGFCLAAGVSQFARGLGRWLNLVFLFVFLAFVFAFLVWAARGKSLNLVGMLQATLQRSVPIALGGLSGVLCERSGVINIAIEGMMLSAAFTAVVVASATGSIWLGLLGAMLIGGLMALWHGWLSIRFRVDQIVSGTVINIFAAGATSYLTARFLVHPEFQHLNNSGIFRPIPIPLLSNIPIIGPILFENNAIIYLMFLVIALIHVGLFYTRWGLRTIAVGEHPRAADTLGIDVYRVRYVSVIMGGMVAGLGGAYFTVGTVGRFDELLTAGKGFIGLAAMIFGKWNPIGTFGASLIFGFADSLQTKLQILRVPIPSEFLLMAPYVITMIVLAGIIGRAIPPAADGQPYVKE
ncbi:MAG: ABC transporter permease [Anaerolineae bacterium]